ncbi:MAG: peptidylprolyl isomerase [Ardenticatenaceae bacterium]|nr:peptidylprolyl isomerase [Anaerolineales bacterium]MCB8976951.1 peptidylprolyl isomerase [Ardenticatenaceae bacterium]
MSEALKVKDGVVVTLEYVLRLDDGDVIDSSEEEGPLEYLHGYGQIIPGLEKALVGMSVGDRKTVVVPPDEAYGDVDMEAFEIVPRSMFPDDIELEEGLELSLRDVETDEPFDATIAEIRETEVMLDFNHPLAGETLHFEVHIPAIREATAEELAHGHAHGEDDHHHD